MGLHPAVWRRYETGGEDLPLRAIDRFTDVTGINPYVLGFFLEWDISRLPENTHEPMRQLREAWEEHIQSMQALQRTMRL